MLSAARSSKKKVTPSSGPSQISQVASSGQQTKNDKSISKFAIARRRIKQAGALAQAIRPPNQAATKVAKKKETRIFNTRMGQLRNRLSDLQNDILGFAPMPGLDLAFRRDELDQRQQQKRAREAQGLPPQEYASPVDEILDQIDQEEATKENRPPKKTDRKKSRTLPRRNRPTPPLAIPKLAPGKKIYSPAEIIPCFVEAAKTKKATALLTYLLESKLIPSNINRDAINWRIRIYKQSPDEFVKNHQFWDTGKTGRHRIISSEELLAKAREMLGSASGSTIGRNEVRKILVEKKKEDLEARGLTTHLSDTELISDVTVKTYTRQLSSMADASDLTVVSGAKLRKKPENRMIAESSLRALGSLLACVACTHFHVGDSYDKEFNDMVKQMSRKNRWYIDIIGEALGSRFLLTCIKAFQGITNDCTTNYFYDDPKSATDDEFRLATRSSLELCRTKALHTVDKNNKKLGVKAKHRFCMSNSGAFASIHITFPDLSERELPKKECPDGLLAISIPGLAPGMDSSIDTTMNGFIVFQRKGVEGASKMRYRHIRECVFFPFVKHLRSANYILNNENAELLTAEQRIVSWTDCDNDQTLEITNDLLPYHESKVTVNQHNPARTGVEQAADLSNVFTILKMGFSNINPDPSPTPLSKRLEKAINDCQSSGQLNLAASKKKIIVKNLQQANGIYARALTIDNVMKGAIKNGMIDEENRRVPSFEAMLATHSKAIAEAEMELISKTLPDLIAIHLEQGHIPETVFDQMGYPEDVDSDGKVFSRTAGISQEYLQRAKTLNHSFQVELREEAKAKVTKKREEALQKKSDLFQIHLQKNLDCESLLLSISSAANVADVAKITFATKKVTVTLLSSFLKVRGVETRSVDRRKDVLVEKAYANRHLPVLTLPTAVPVVPTTIPTIPTKMPISIRQRLKPSDLAKDTAWVSRMLCAIGKDQDEETAGRICCEKLSHADKFQQMLLPRLQQQLDHRLDQTKHFHWLIIDFIVPNLAHFALLMVLQGHVRDDFAGVGPNDCLLNPNIDLFVNSGMANLHGAYLYYDKARGKFIRSGKATGRPFLARHNEHEKASKNLNGESSKFYLTFPHSTSAIQPEGKLGKFEDLSMVVAFGVSLTEYKLWTESADDAGIFHLPTSVLSRISALKGFDRGHHRSSLTEKTMHLVSYLAELVYDVCIPEKDSVSESFGFEAVLRPNPGIDVGAEALT